MPKLSLKSLREKVIEELKKQKPQVYFGFVVKEGVNMLTSKSHVDITSFALTLANSIGIPVVYLDFKNGLSLMTSRNLDRLMEKNPNLYYIHHSFMDFSYDRLIKTVKTELGEDVLMVVDNLNALLTTGWLSNGAGYHRFFSSFTHVVLFHTGMLDLSAVKYVEDISTTIYEVSQVSPNVYKLHALKKLPFLDNSIQIQTKDYSILQTQSISQDQEDQILSAINLILSLYPSADQEELINLISTILKHIPKEIIARVVYRFYQEFKEKFKEKKKPKS